MAYCDPGLLSEVCLIRAVPRDVWQRSYAAKSIAWIVASACAAVIGCGGNEGAEVAGRVTLKGQPLANGTIAFRSVSGATGAYVSADIVDGSYQVTSHVPPGRYHVDVRSMRKTGRKVMSPFKVEIDEVVDIIPAHYTSGESEIATELAPGANVFDVDLKP